MPVARDEWIDLARSLDWTYAYATETEVFPELVAGRPWLPHAAWQGVREPERTSAAGEAADPPRADDAWPVGMDLEAFRLLDPQWLCALKLQAAIVPLAEFAAAVGSLRAARFGRTSEWRTIALSGALDELRDAQAPLLAMHELVRWDPQFAWTHKLYHSNHWVAIAARHLTDEMRLAADPIELAVARHLGLAIGFAQHPPGGGASDERFRLGPAVLAALVAHDRAYAQRLVDKWLWRQWHLFAVVTGFTMDYLTPLASRRTSFKEVMAERVLGRLACSLTEVGLDQPWYWDELAASIDSYHHMVYASAYSYRATMWLDLPLPGPDERAWLRDHYPATWDELDPIWTRITERWRTGGPELEWYAHGTTAFGFCHLCQLVLSAGTPSRNTARVVDIGDRRHIFCSAPCAWIFEQDRARYAGHRDVVQRVLEGDAPANLLELIRTYFGGAPGSWGKDLARGRYPWLERP